ncbi:MAG: NUDIX domain-containing protein [Cyanobacteria bacterium P01_F01_bin.42]
MKAVAIAILYYYRSIDTVPELLMQLRDLVPGIVYPGHWGLFGGHLEPGESPEDALRRELEEEIEHCPNVLRYFGDYGDDTIHRHIFTAPLTVHPSRLVLREGWDMALLPWSKLKTGRCYSKKAKQVCPIGEPHLLAIADFFENQTFGNSVP